MPELHHLALRTAEPARLADFYVEILGFGPKEPRGNGAVWLRAEGVVLMFERAAAGEPTVAVGSMDLLAFAVTADEKAGVSERLRARGVPVDGRTAFTLYFRDLDGRRIGVSNYSFSGSTTGASLGGAASTGAS